ncbi:MAG: molybdopterin converting factor subunit 1 [Planctomycetota bacterium]
MRIRILLFAGLREKAGTAEITLELPAKSTLAAARAAVEERMPNLLKNAKAAAAVNGAYVRDESREMNDGDEIAFLPPVSGG